MKKLPVARLVRDDDDFVASFGMARRRRAVSVLIRAFAAIVVGLIFFCYAPAPEMVKSWVDMRPMDGGPPTIYSARNYAAVLSPWFWVMLLQWACLIGGPFMSIVAIILYFTPHRAVRDNEA